MKKILLSVLFLGVIASLFGQQSAKRYVMLEHFTNTKCPICANKNPAFYNLINQYPSDVHHISIHPPVPYNTCKFYLANTTENNSRANYYGIVGSPSLAINGNLQAISTPLLSASTLQAQLNQTSPLYIKVNETTAGINRNINVQSYSLGDIPAGSYKLFVAIVEKTINYNAPNGETVHHDVFRKMLPSIDGLAFSPATKGQHVNNIFSINLDPSWNADEIYALVFVQNTQTKEILNSGTKFDPIVLADLEPTTNSLKFSPNPAVDETWIEVPEQENIQSVEVWNVQGLRQPLTFEVDQNQIRLDLHTLRPGFYVVSMRSNDHMYSAKLIKNSGG